MESAKGVIKVMAQAGLEPNNETHKALLCGYARQGLVQDISATLSMKLNIKVLLHSYCIHIFLGDCEKNEVIMHDRDLLEVLYTAAVNNHSSVVDDLLTRMRKLSGYNQDCINVILRLVNCGQEDEAFKVLLSMKPPLLNDGQMPSVGGFFIRQVVKCRCKPEKIVKFCQKLVDSGMNPRAYFRALEAANAFGDKDLSQVLLQEITKQKEKLRPQAFWPLLVTLSLKIQTTLPQITFHRTPSPKLMVKKEYSTYFVKWPLFASFLTLIQSISMSCPILPVKMQGLWFANFDLRMYPPVLLPYLYLLKAWIAWISSLLSK